MTYVLFVVGFYLLIKGADLLVDGASSIAGRLRISSLIIGLTVVAFGTSLPELVVNLFASFEGNADLAIANVLGSNIANILLIVGIAAVISPLPIQENTARHEIPLSILSVIVLALLASDTRWLGREVSELTRSDGLVLLCFLAVFLHYTISLVRSQREVHIPVIETHSMMSSVVRVVLGLVGLTLGGKWIVDGAIVIAISLGMSETLVGLTIVAIGTSLPELATSVAAAWKGQAGMAIGNVIGSNIFNIFWILGISAVVNPLPFDSANEPAIVVTLAASLLLQLFVVTGVRSRVGRWEGWLMLAFYVLFMAYSVYANFAGEQGPPPSAGRTRESREIQADPTSITRCERISSVCPRPAEA